MTGVAIVGVSPRNFMANDVIKNHATYGDGGPIWAVNPRYTDEGGLQYHPSLSSLPSAPETVVVVVAGERVLSAVAESVELGARHVVVVADGFAEHGRDDLEAQLVQLVEGSRTTLYGPNCLGFIDMAARSTPFAIEMPPGIRPGPVSFLSQSGGMVVPFMAALANEGSGIDYCVSIGNGAAFDMTDALLAAIERPSTRVICLYAESLGRSPQEFGEALDLARRRDKWVIVLKGGASARASRAALSHTASMVGSDNLVSAFLAAHHAIRVHSVEELVRTARICSAFESRPTGGVAIIGSSGGSAILASDLAHRHALRLAEFTPETKEYLAENAPEGSFTENPLDIIHGETLGGDELWRRVHRDPNVDFAIMLWSHFYPEPDAGVGVAAPLLMFREIATTSGVPAANVALGVQAWSAFAESQRDVDDPSYMFFRGLEGTIQALANVFPGTLVETTGRPSGHAGVHDADMLDEESAREALRACGLPLVDGRTFPVGEEPITGDLHYPTVVKIVAKGVSHKAKVGGVRLNCVSELEAQIAAREIVEAVQRSGVALDAILGVRVEEMASGIELLVGLQRDPSLGPFVTVGIGGSLTEAIRTTRTMQLPTSANDIATELTEIRLWSALGDNADSFVDFVQTVCHEFIEGRLRRFTTVELNPVIVGQAGIRIADVLLVSDSESIASASATPTD